MLTSGNNSSSNQSNHSPDPFFSHQPNQEEKELKLHDAVTVPEPFHYAGAHEIKDIHIKYKEDYDPSNILFEDVIVEYKPYAGQEKRFEDFRATYLKSYVIVGIRNARYMWLFKKACEIAGEGIVWRSYPSNNDYTWVSAQIPPDGTVYDDVQCYAYSKQENDTVPMGTLHEVLTGLKSNIVGYGQFTIRVMKNFRGEHVLSLLLTGFQMTDITKTQSLMKPFVPTPPSDSLLNALEGLYINKS